MATRTITDRDAYTIVISANSAGASGVTVLITDSIGHVESYTVDPADDLTAAQRTTLNNFCAAFRNRARTAGGWT